MYIEQAYKGDNEWWKVLITTVMCAGIFIANLIVFIVMDIDSQAEIDKLMELFKSKNLFLAANLLPFAGLLVLLFVLVWALHRRSILSLTTTRKKVDLKRVFFSFMLVFVYTVGSFLVMYYMYPESFELQFDLAKFSVLFIIGLVLFPFQIGLEEWLFRGYLMQQIGIAVRNKWFPLLFTSIIFGVFHWANPEVAAMGSIAMVFYIGTGLLLGIMTLMDEGLELALGFHFGNNFLAATLLTFDYSALQTDAIFKSIEPPGTGTELVLPVLIVYPIFLFILAKKYKWTNWKEKLTGKVQRPLHEGEVIV